MFDSFNMTQLKALYVTLGDMPKAPAKKADLIAVLESEAQSRGLTVGEDGTWIPVETEEPEADEADADAYGEPQEVSEDEGEDLEDEAEEPAPTAAPQQRRVPKVRATTGKRRAEYGESDVIRRTEKDLKVREGTNRAARFGGIVDGMTVGQYLDHAFASNGELRARHRYHGDVRKLVARGLITVEPAPAVTVAATPAAEEPSGEAEAA